MSYIEVNYAQMEAAASQMRTISSRIDTELDTLRSKLQQMTWGGDDREAYNAHQARWDAAIRDINTLLNEIGGAVGIARENYVTTEMSNAKMW